MYRIKLALILSSLGIYSYSQNDLDAIRYSRIGGGGSARFMSMGGAFGAVGADLSSASYNPAGLGVFRKGEISVTAGFRATNNSGDIYNRKTSIFDLNPVFNNFGFAVAWKGINDSNRKHRQVVAFTNTQLQNFNNYTRMSGYTNSSSIAKDMLNLAEYYKPATGNITQNMSNSYEGLAYDTYLFDTYNGSFFSFLDTKRSVKQTRDIVTSGRVNDLNFSYAYTYMDRFYLGASIGVPQVNYESTITHIEEDDRDSMQVILTSDSTFTDTYIDPLPTLSADYDTRLGFKSLQYTEYFKTTGSGINVKLGGIVRISDMVRVGLYYHTPTWYRFQDTYYNDLTVTFDASPGNPDYKKFPEDGGYFKYRIITPSKISVNAAFIIKKLAVIGVDYEFVNYKNARFVSEDRSNFDDVNYFDDVNSLINSTYKGGHNVRVGGELNLNPLMLRLGYNMQGSPFGDVFAGDYVRNTFSAGFGFRTKNNFFFDFVVYNTQSTEKYNLFTDLNTSSKLKYNSTTFSATFGLKF